VKPHSSGIALGQSMRDAVSGPNLLARWSPAPRDFNHRKNRSIDQLPSIPIASLRNPEFAYAQAEIILRTFWGDTGNTRLGLRILRRSRHAGFGDSWSGPEHKSRKKQGIPASRYRTIAHEQATTYILLSE
jgi:hypothetical protein